MAVSPETSLFAVQRGGKRFQCLGSELAGKLEANDIIAVHRPDDGETYAWTVIEFRLPWEGLGGGIWHIKNVKLTPVVLDGPQNSYRAWDVDGTNERMITQVNIGEEVVFVGGDSAKELFRRCKADWEFGEYTDISLVTNMWGMFYDAWEFNDDIGGWDTSHVTNMNDMFARAFRFNMDIGNWNTSKLTNMRNMFNEAREFNQSINTKQVTVSGKTYTAWDTSNVTDMKFTFKRAYLFDSDISNWNVGNVKTTYGQFENAHVFNRDLSGWDVSNVTTMGEMFDNAQVFNQDLSGWCVDKYPANNRFRSNSAMPTDGSHDPVWGTCPP